MLTMLPARVQCARPQVWSLPKAGHKPLLTAAAGFRIAHKRAAVVAGSFNNGNGNGNGSASSLSLPNDGFEIVESDGRKFVALEQAMALFEDAESALSKAKQETVLLRTELLTLQATVAEHEQKRQEVHQQRVETARTSRAHFTQMKEQEEELGTLRAKIAAAVQEAQAAREAEANAMSIALRQLEAKVAKAYIEGRDRQLSAMEKSLKSALAAVADAQEATVSRVRAAEAQTLQNVQSAVGRVEAEATSSTKLALASADSARAGSAAAAESAQRALRQQAATAALAQQLFAEARAATDRAAAAHAESNALQLEVTELRNELKAAAESRKEALKVSADNQAQSVVRIREVMESSEARIQEMYHAFEALKHNERQAAQAARNEAAHHAWRCQEAENRERGLVEQQVQLKEALAQAVARARAAEDKLEERSVSLESEFAQKVELIKQESEADKGVGIAAAAEQARVEAHESIDAARRDLDSAVDHAAAERTNLSSMLQTAAKENEYWRERARRLERAVQSMQHDIKIAAKAMPDDKNKLKLQFQSDEMKVLLEHGVAQLPTVELPDHIHTENGKDAGLGNWLPPLTDLLTSTNK